MGGRKYANTCMIPARNLGQDEYRSSTCSLPYDSAKKDRADLSDIPRAQLEPVYAATI